VLGATAGASPAVDRPTAQASILGTNQCPSGDFCGWSDGNFQGSVFLHDAGPQPLDTWLGLPNSNNLYSSIYNHRVNSTLVADGGPSSPTPSACIPPGSAWNLNGRFYSSGGGGTMDNTISSIKMQSFVSC
jgi:hypothetical protein